jgi:hypothetical protein
MSSETDGSSVSLFKQLEVTRFDRALSATETLAQNRSLLTTMELERLNGILVGKPIETSAHSGTSLWRDSPVTLSLPSGRTETLSILRDPKLTAREHLHEATELAENGHAIDAAVSVYVKFVLSHVFKDANRRTAVLAAHSLGNHCLSIFDLFFGWRGGMAFFQAVAFNVAVGNKTVNFCRSRSGTLPLFTDDGAQVHIRDQ